MPNEKRALGIEYLCQRCGVTFSDLSRISGISRATLYKLKSGGSVRKSTVVKLLQSMEKMNRFARVRYQIKEELKELGARRKRADLISEVLDDLDDLILELRTRDERLTGQQRSRLEEYSDELRKMVQEES